MKLKRSPPPGRTAAQLENHFLVERELAERLKVANREERKRIYSTMYDELFSRVPDHSRLLRRASNAETRRNNAIKLSLVRRFISPGKTFAEFASGDCLFAYEAAKSTSKVYAIDISDQRDPKHKPPENFTLIVYDGYTLPQISDEEIDVVSSDNLIEHIHPDETSEHFRLAYRILRKGGVYFLRTPHALNGPHDISKYFSDVAEGFHLKEWTFREITEVLRDAGFSNVRTYWAARGTMFRVPLSVFRILESLINLMPRSIGRRAARFVTPHVACAAIK